MVRLLLVVVITAVVQVQGCHYTEVEYAWSIGPAPKIPTMEDNETLDWAKKFVEPAVGAPCSVGLCGSYGPWSDCLEGKQTRKFEKPEVDECKECAPQTAACEDRVQREVCQDPYVTYWNVPCLDVCAKRNSESYYTCNDVNGTRDYCSMTHKLSYWGTGKYACKDECTRDYPDKTYKYYKDYYDYHMCDTYYGERYYCSPRCKGSK